MANVDDDSDDDDDDEEAPEMHLGFAVKADDQTQLLRNHFPSKLGGAPAWLDPVRLPLTHQLQCKESGLQLRFLLQIYSAIHDDPRQFHRSIYLFISPQGSVLGRPGAVRAFRTQLPRKSPYYSAEPPRAGDRPRTLEAADARAAELRNPRWALRAREDDGAAAGGVKVGLPIPSFPEFSLEVEPEPDDDDDAMGGDEYAQRLMDEYKANGGGDTAAAERLLSGKGDAAAGSVAENDAPPVNPTMPPLPPAPKPLGGDGGGSLTEQASAAAGGAPFKADMNPEIDDFSNFTARVARAPAQCLRYAFDEDAKPLWASRARRPPADIPPCNLCGGPRCAARRTRKMAAACPSLSPARSPSHSLSLSLRLAPAQLPPVALPGPSRSHDSPPSRPPLPPHRRFEFQVMPQTLHFLGVDPSDSEAPDWATIAVYTCAKSCAPAAPHPSLDTVPHGSDEALAASYVGETVEVHGLEAKPEVRRSPVALFLTHSLLLWPRVPVASARVGAAQRGAAQRGTAAGRTGAQVVAALPPPTRVQVVSSHCSRQPCLLHSR